ncbi:hypothetical protein [Actinacidiphila acididurans]|uniref:Uncharacterized protein n=1 Tax=Actinacidiphila acididurans TaxID=2784346 RepID=A0ABS2U050_9ACTN|nr:hypothetical protein [Actinacidiphila acididurans]MBM9508978.1 hypothetical protein [Actinacidiphila acididurans]
MPDDHRNRLAARVRRLRHILTGPVGVWLLSALACLALWKLASVFVPLIMKYVFFGGIR